MGIVTRVANALVSPGTLSGFPKSVIVPDISFYQDRNDTPAKVDFQKMKAAGARGVILRAGQSTWVDEDVRDYWAASNGVFPRGLYWFYDSRSRPVDQAKIVAGLVETLGLPEMEIWADYEEKYGGAYKGWSHFSAFLMELERLLPDAKVGIYTGYDYWLHNSPNPITEKAAFDWFGRFPLWLAWYTANESVVKIPKPWTEALYWQFTSKGDGTKYGVESKSIDLSYFNGFLDAFNLRYAQTTPLPEPTPAPAVRVIKRVETIVTFDNGDTETKLWGAP